jgi:uncharacterized protein YggE
MLAIALVVSMGLAAAWMWGQTASPVAAQSSDGDSGYSPAETIMVVGQGSARMEPDVARVSVGVETSAETVDEAVAENTARMESIMDALAAAGIDDKDIQTTNYSIQLDRYREPMPRAGEEEEQPPITYRVSNMVNVTVRDLDSIGEVIDAVVEAGANSVWGVSFGLDDPSLAQAAARADAVADAEARAQSLADLSGVELGPVMSISEVISGGAVPMPVMAEMAASGAGPISPGELEVTYRLQVAYFIER